MTTKFMRPIEVYDFINSQEEWTDEEKEAVKRLFRTYIFMLDSDSVFKKSAVLVRDMIEKNRKNLAHYGIVV